MFKRYFIKAVKDMFRNYLTELPNYVKIEILSGQKQLVFC